MVSEHQHQKGVCWRGELLQLLQLLLRLLPPQLLPHQVLPHLLP
jgi:hypothetical protein